MAKRIIALAFLTVSLVSNSFGQTTEEIYKSAFDAFERRDYEAASAALDVVLSRQPANEPAMTLRARIFARQSKYPEARAAADKILLRNPRSFEAINVRGLVRRELDKDLPGALADFQKAVAVNPSYYLGTLNIGVTYMRMGRGAEADEALTKAIALSPETPEGYDYRARNNVNRGRYKASLADYDKVVALAPRNANYLAARGYSHFRIYIEDDSKPTSLFKSDADAALAIQPDNPVALSVRAAGRFVDGRADEALVDANRAVALNPNWFMSYMVLGFVKSTRKDAEGAFVEFENAARLMPNDNWVTVKLEAAAGDAKSPRALAVQKQAATRKSETAAREIAAGKLEVASKPWDFWAYDRLNDSFSKHRAYVAEFAARDYWESLVAQNAANVCAVRFLGEYKGGWREMIDYLDAGLRRYDGRNGAECAAQIAFRIGREYSDRRLFSDAESYFAKAKALKSDLKYLDGNIAVNASEKAEAEKPLPVVTTPSAATGGNGSSRNTKPKPKPVDPARVKLAIADYDATHAKIERDLRELMEATDKYKKAGLYRSMYRGTYDRIMAIQVRMMTAIDNLLKRQKGVLPEELVAHIKKDRAEVEELEVPSPYQ